MNVDSMVKPGQAGGSEDHVELHGLGAEDLARAVVNARRGHEQAHGRLRPEDSFEIDLAREKVAQEVHVERVDGRATVAPRSLTISGWRNRFFTELSPTARQNRSRLARASSRLAPAPRPAGPR